MDLVRARARLEGCYITIPTMFADPELGIDHAAITRHVGWLRGRGITPEYGTLLAGGAAGDFSTMTFDERVAVAETVRAAAGALPVAMGAQTTSTLELRRLAKAAARLGCEYIQVSCPFYFAHTEEDFYATICEAAAAADIGIIVYNTFWTSAGVSFKLVERLVAEVPNVVGLKWACPRTDAMEFEDVVASFHNRLTVIDNHLMFAVSAMLGARAFEVHLANYWPEWGVRLVDRVAAEDYKEVQRMLVAEAMPFYKLWLEIERTTTSGDGYLDKLCMELVGLDSSRCRPPTRDVRDAWRDRTRAMMLATGVPGVVAA